MPLMSIVTGLVAVPNCPGFRSAPEGITGSVGPKPTPKSSTTSPDFTGTVGNPSEFPAGPMKS